MSKNQAGKGSKARPLSVSREERSIRYDLSYKTLTEQETEKLLERLREINEQPKKKSLRRKN